MLQICEIVDDSLVARFQLNDADLSGLMQQTKNQSITFNYSASLIRLESTTTKLLSFAASIRKFDSAKRPIQRQRAKYWPGCPMPAASWLLIAGAMMKSEEKAD
jgi:hypothetical protein